jgi:hypothetical protein
MMTAQVEHTDDNHFVINTASFHAPFQHHEISGTILPQIQNADMAQCAMEGFRKWGNDNFVNVQPHDDAVEDQNA